MTLEQYYEKSRQRHVNFIRNKLHFNKDQAEDIVQEAFIRAFIYFKNYDPNKGKLDNWFSQILFRTYLKFLKAKGNSHDSINRHLNIEDSRNYNEIIENLCTVEKVIKRVENKLHRDILKLFYLVGYTTPEIHEILGVSETSISQVCFRFRKQLKSEWGLSL